MRGLLESTEGCSLGWLVSMRGLLESTEGWLGCSLEMREMAVMVTWAGRLGLMGCSSGSGLHEQGLVCRGSWQGCPGCQVEGSKQARIQRGSCHLRRWRQKVR